MEWRNFSKSQLKENIFSILSFQFNIDFARLFMEPFKQFTFKFSKRTGKLRYIYLDSKIQATYRPTSGLFALSLEAIARIYKKIKFPHYRVQVLSEISDFIKDGKSVFAKHVVNIDPNLKIGEQVIVVDEEDNLLSLGQLKMPVNYIKSFESGVAVDVKKGINKLK